MADHIERRANRGVTVEQVEASEGRGVKMWARVAGYAAVFEQLSQPLGGFVERIAPGAFARALTEAQDVRALVEHDPARIIGRSKSGTLTMVEDAHGLRVEIDPADTSVGRDLITSIRRGDLDAMSFGFVARRDEWREDAEHGVVRTILDADLFDVSVVAYPAYQQTEVALRSLDRWRAGLPLLSDLSIARARLRLSAD